MVIKILGAFGGRDGNRKTTSFLFRDFVIDAGSLFPHILTFGISSFLLTHSHLDHIVDLPLFLDFAFSRLKDSLKVFAGAETINSLREHIFNNSIWPDFSALFLPSGKPSLEFVEIAPFVTFGLGKFVITPFPANHSVETFGFKVEEGDSAVLISGDTKSNPVLWDILNADSSIKALFVDVSFPSRLKEVAENSGHYTPATLAEDMERNLKRDVDIYVYHVKPAYYLEVVKEVREKIPIARILEDNTTVEV